MKDFCMGLFIGFMWGAGLVVFHTMLATGSNTHEQIVELFQKIQ